jgi:hypothetical protein
MYYRNPIKIMCTTRLDSGIFYGPLVFRCGSRSAAQIGCVSRFYVYGGIFDNPPGYLATHRNIWQPTGVFGNPHFYLHVEYL